MFRKSVEHSFLLLLVRHLLLLAWHLLLLSWTSGVSGFSQTGDASVKALGPSVRFAACACGICACCLSALLPNGIYADKLQERHNTTIFKVQKKIDSRDFCFQPLHATFMSRSLSRTYTLYKVYGTYSLHCSTPLNMYNFKGPTIDPTMLALQNATKT